MLFLAEIIKDYQVKVHKSYTRNISMIKKKRTKFDIYVFTTWILRIYCD